MSVQPEAKFKQELKKRFAETFAGVPHYWLPLVASTFQRAGIPDLYAAIPGKRAWIEAKVNGNGLSKVQEKEIGDMRRAGVRVVVLHAYMHIAKDQRKAELYGPLGNEPPTIFRWADLSTPLFWHAVLG